MHGKREQFSTTDRYKATILMVHANGIRKVFGLCFTKHHIYLYDIIEIGLCEFVPFGFREMG